MVRRTKAELNEAITRDPELLPRCLRRPLPVPAEASPKPTKTGETEADIALATEIESLMSGLKGIPFLANLTGGSLQSRDDRAAGAVPSKSACAPPRPSCSGTCANMLRSSRAALIEHLLGTKAALLEFGLKEFKNQNTGNIIQKKYGI